MRSSKTEFFTLLTFMVVACLVLTNGFVERIFAKDNQVDAFQSVEPIADVLTEIMRSYVREPDVDKVVEGALIGMMNSLDKHSSYVPPEALKELTSDTEGQFDGIGIIIKLDEDKNIVVAQPLPGSPAAKAGMMAGDVLLKIDQVDAKGMSLVDAAHRIKGPRGSVVHLTVYRRGADAGEQLEFDVKRDVIPLESVTEARLLDGGVAYVRIREFSKTTARDIESNLKEFQKQGMKSLIIDLRWNPGGLLSASKEVAELFLPKNTLVTYTKGRAAKGPGQSDSMTLYTEREPVLPAEMPIIILINGLTASSSEIVTGALQFWERAIVIGEKSYGKGSVQTVIQLNRPAGSALRLTTALYYTPAKVTIDNEGIKPDIDVPMSLKDQSALLNQFYKSYESDLDKKNMQNHGAVTGDAAAEGTVEDVQLQRAVEVLKEDSVFANLIAKYHKDVAETQTSAAENSIDLSSSAGRHDVTLQPPAAESDSPPTSQQ